MRAAHGVSLLMAALGLGGCSVSDVFQCREDGQCDFRGQDGHCAETGYCSLAATDCDSGWRYVPESPGDLAGQCVPEDGGDGGDDGGDGVEEEPGHCVVKVAAGRAHTCAANQNNQVYCWGRNENGQTGSPPASVASGPMPVHVEFSFTSIEVLEAGDDHTCVLDRQAANGQVVCWGRNDQAQSGPAADPVLAPSVFDELNNPNEELLDLAVGARHTCIGRSNLIDSIVCWGDNEGSQIREGEKSPIRTLVSPYPLPEPRSPDLVAGEYASAVSGQNGTGATVVQTWGTPTGPALGRGMDAASEPEQTSPDVALTGLAAGRAHICGIDGGSQLYCWGDGENGRLGVSGTQYGPVPVAGLGEVAAVRGGGRHTCVLATNGALLCFGDNAQGQLGDAADGGTAPHIVPGIWQDAALGFQHSCAIDDDDILFCWGDNSEGQLGHGAEDGTAASRWVHVPCD